MSTLPTKCEQWPETRVSNPVYTYRNKTGARVSVSIIHLYRFFRAFGQKSPHVVLESLHVHFLCRLCVVDLDLVDLVQVRKFVNCLENIPSLEIIITEVFDAKPQKLRGLCYSPCAVQGLDHPPHRWRRPLDLVRLEVCCHLKAGYCLNLQILQHHHHCHRPEEEDWMWDVVSSQFHHQQHHHQLKII